MQSACSGGTGTFIEKTARKLQVASEQLAAHALRGHEPAQGQQQVRHLRRDRRQHAGEDRGAGRGDHRQPVRGGGLPEPRHAHQGQHPGARGAAAGRPEPLLQGAAGGLAPPPGQAVGAAEARAARGARSGLAHHGARGGALLRLPRLRGDRRGRGRRASRSTRAATGCAGGWRRASRRRRPRRAAGRSWPAPRISPRSWPSSTSSAPRPRAPRRSWRARSWSAATSAAPPPRRSCSRPRASCSSPATRSPRATRSRTPSRSSARSARRATRTSAGSRSPATARICCKDVVGADVAVVETVAHATGTLHFHPDADVICDVGGTDVKIMILRQGTVADFRLNSQCSSGNGAFLQGVAERYSIAARGLRGEGLRGQGDADARDGLRRVPPVRHRQPAAQGLGRGGDHGRAGRGAAGQRVDLRGPAAESRDRSGASSSCRAAPTATWRW